MGCDAEIFDSLSPARVRSILNVLAVAVLLAGYSGAALAWRAQVRAESASESDPLSTLDSRQDTRQLQFYYGSSGVLIARAVAWIKSLTHGKSLAKALVVLSSVIAIWCFVVAGHIRRASST